MSQSKPARSRQTDRSEADFIKRWSRLKHQAGRQADQQAGSHAMPENVTEDPGQTINESSPPPRTLTDADMPDIDGLTADSVFSDFLSPGVSEKLRKLALRKLFHSEAFNIRDGLDEYDDDYTQFEKLGDIVTSDMRHQMEVEARRKARQLMQKDDQAGDEKFRGHDGSAGPEHSIDLHCTDSGSETGDDDKEQERAAAGVEPDGVIAGDSEPVAGTKAGNDNERNHNHTTGD